jgi:hypothetical protein
VKEVFFLAVEDVVFLHADTIDIDGGPPEVRDHGLLDAAVAMSRQQFGGTSLHKDLAAMAAAYFFHIAQNHPFIDGNKRGSGDVRAVFFSTSTALRNCRLLKRWNHDPTGCSWRVEQGHVDATARGQIGKRK